MSYNSYKNHPHQSIKSSGIHGSSTSSTDSNNDNCCCNSTDGNDRCCCDKQCGRFFNLYRGPLIVIAIGVGFMLVGAIPFSAAKATHSNNSTLLIGGGFIGFGLLIFVPGLLWCLIQRMLYSPCCHKRCESCYSSSQKKKLQDDDEEDEEEEKSHDGEDDDEDLEDEEENFSHSNHGSNHCVLNMGNNQQSNQNHHSNGKELSKYIYDHQEGKLISQNPDKSEEARHQNTQTPMSRDDDVKTNTSNDVIFSKETKNSLPNQA